MDKLVKKEVLTVYISQFTLIIVALFCCLVPLFSESPYLPGWKAITGLCILASVFVVNIFYMTTQFQVKKSLLPGKIALECMGEMFFRIDENCNKGKWSIPAADLKKLIIHYSKLLLENYEKKQELTYLAQLKKILLFIVFIIHFLNG